MDHVSKTEKKIHELKNPFQNIAHLALSQVGICRPPPTLRSGHIYVKDEYSDGSTKNHIFMFRVIADCIYNLR